MSVIYIIAMDVTLPYLATGFKVAKFERARQTCKRLFLKYLPSYPLAFGLSQNYEIFFNSKGYAFEKSIVIYYCPLKPEYNNQSSMYHAFYMKFSQRAAGGGVQNLSPVSSGV